MNGIVECLQKKRAELEAPFSVSWRYPEQPAADPLSATPDASWKSWTTEPMPLRKNEKHWVYGEVVFPEARCGIPLDGTEAQVFIHGWCPFTLWMDGAEVFREEHAWHATGPIVDPVPLQITPGSAHRLVVCLEPTEIPNGFGPLQISVRPRAGAEMAVQVSAAVAQLQFAAVLARTQAEKHLVKKAERRVDVAALESHEWPRLMDSFRAMEKLLRPLSARAKGHTVYLLGHSHIDMDWMWTWKDTEYCIRRDFKAVTDLMDECEDLRFTISQIPSYDVIRTLDPAVFEKVKARVAEGRWENAAATWVEGDLHMADGETLARHMLYAADWAREHLGSKAGILWEPDTFGHPGNMPQLARLGELDAYFHMRCNPGRQDFWPVREWEGIDGSTITAVTELYNGDLSPCAVIQSAIRACKRGLRQSLHPWGIGDHGGAVSRCMLHELSLYRDKPLVPTCRFGTLGEFLSAVRASRVSLPRKRGEEYSLFEGCWTTHAELKQQNRHGESALLTAEALCAMAGLDRRKALREAWVPILFNQFHDLMDGSAVHDSYVDTSARARKSLAAARNVAAEAMNRLAAAVEDGDSVTVLNALGFERTEPVAVRLPHDTTHLLDAQGRAIPVQRRDGEFVFVAERVPAFGLRSYRIARGCRKVPAWPAVTVDETRDYGEQGDYFRVETACAVSRISKANGVIGGYYDKALQEELIGYGVPKYLSHVPVARLDLGMNLFQVIDESPNAMSAWLIHNVLREENLLRDADVKLVDSGPVFARFHVTHKFRSSRIEEDVYYYQSLSRVDFAVTVDWRERGDAERGVPQLKMAFAGAASAVRATFEGPFAVTERPANGQEQPTQKWVDVTGERFGFAVLNDGRYGCDVLGGRLRMTLLRNPYGPDPETDNGIHSVALSFVPHGPGTAAAAHLRAGMGFNRKMIAVVTRRAANSGPAGLRLEGDDSVVCTGLRRAEHSDHMLIRFFETSGKRSRIRFKLGRRMRAVREVNFLENPVGARVRIQSGMVAAVLRPFEIKTFAIETSF